MANKNPSESTRFKAGNKAREVETPKQQISIRLPPELIEYAEEIGNNRSDGIEKALMAHREREMSTVKDLYPVGKKIEVEVDYGGPSVIAEVVNHFTRPFSQLLGGVVVKTADNRYITIESSFLKEDGSGL